jgi:pimeloyl-ACP methyl ester carboxylesterase
MVSRMKRRIVYGALAGGAALAGARVARHYRRDAEAAAARLDSVDRKTIRTTVGIVEYAEQGAGDPLLVVHGIFQGCDGALLSASDLSQGRRLIAPSRFGYLGSSLAPGATPATQADAFALLLDELAIAQTDVVAISAGTTSALLFALRHPDRIKRLAVISGSWPGNPTAVAPPRWTRVFVADFPIWAVKVFARPVLLQLMGVPTGLPLTAEAASFRDAMADSMFPVGPRAQGVTFDAFISNPEVNNVPLEAITVPTLIVHAQDDPLTSHEAAERAAVRIPLARFDSVPSGGHLLLCQHEEVRSELATFLASR